MNLNHDKRLIIKTALIVTVIFFIFSGVMKHITKNKTQSLPLPTVVIQKPKVTKMTEYVTQTGTIVAYNSVDLVARIEGYLEAIEFTDGTFVKKGKE